MRWTICQLLAFVFRKIYPFPQINSQLPVISLFLIKVDRGLTIPPLSSFIKEERRGCVWSLPLVLTCPAFKMAGGFKRSASPSPWVMEVCPPLSRALAPWGQTIKWRNFPPAPTPLYQGLNPSDFIKQSSGELELQVLGVNWKTMKRFGPFSNRKEKNLGAHDWLYITSI